MADVNEIWEFTESVDFLRLTGTEEVDHRIKEYKGMNKTGQTESDWRRITLTVILKRQRVIFTFAILLQYTFLSGTVKSLKKKGCAEKIKCLRRVNV